MKHALHLPPFGTFGDVHLLVELARGAESAGWDGFFLWDHVLYASDVPFVDCWLGLGAISTATERMEVGPMVTPLPRRRAATVARQAVTLDHLSRGRLTVGLGLGIDFWREFSAFAEPASDDRRRAELLDDGIAVLRGLWSGDVVDRGGSTPVRGVRFLPTPVRPGGIPLWTGALWPLRRGPARRAATVDGLMPFSPTGPIPPAELVSLRQALGVVPAYDICIQGPAEWSADYEEAGVTWLCRTFGPGDDLARARATIDAGPPRSTERPQP